MSEDLTIPHAKLREVGVTALCAEWVEGASIRKIAEKYEVSKSDLHRFLSLPEHKAQYEAAKQERALTFAEEVIGIADDSNPGEHQHAKLRINSRQWLASKLDPATFGDTKSPLVNISITEAHLAALRLSNG